MWYKGDLPKGTSGVAERGLLNLQLRPQQVTQDAGPDPVVAKLPPCTEEALRECKCKQPRVPQRELAKPEGKVEVLTAIFASVSNSKTS